MIYTNDYSLNYILPNTKASAEEGLDVRQYLYSNARESCIKRVDTLGFLEEGRSKTPTTPSNGRRGRSDNVKFEPIAVLKAPDDEDVDTVAAMMRQIGLDAI